jgi:hypothetical protein
MSLVVTACLIAFVTAGCGSPAGDPELTKNVYMELVDWHVAGLWVINSPVAWVRVMNYNRVPVTNVTFQYNTFDDAGTPLDEGNYTINDSNGNAVVVPPGVVRNYIELYLGVVNLRSQKLRIKLLSVSQI